MFLKIGGAPKPLISPLEMTNLHVGPWSPQQFPTSETELIRVDPSCRLVPDPALEAIRLSSIDLCVGLFIIEGRQQRHATFEALHGHHDVETFLDVLRTTPRVFLLHSATSAKPFLFVRTSF